MTTYRAQDKSKEIAFFDAHGTNDDKYDVFTLRANSRLINAFVQLSGLLGGSRVADLGCGSGECGGFPNEAKFAKLHVASDTPRLTTES
jgi:hypothetical protein